MPARSVLFSLILADLRERTRRTSFLITLCLALYLGYGVNTGQILIKLDNYRGVYNSAWVGSLMALVISFFLGLIGFFLVKDTLQRDEQTGVGQILATTAITRPQYLLGKWLSNFAVLALLVLILMAAAVGMQLIQREAAQIQLWALFAPFLFVSLPMLALTAALAVLFETVPWLKGGFGNLVYFGLFIALMFAGVMLPQPGITDVVGLNLVGLEMRAAAKAAFPDYTGTFVLAMISDNPLQTFTWSGLDWSLGLIAQRLLWPLIALGLVLLSALWFNRFDHFAGQKTARGNLAQGTLARGIFARAKRLLAPGSAHSSSEVLADANVSLEAPASPVETLRASALTPVVVRIGSFSNALRLVWLEGLLLLKGLPWYIWVGGVGVWLGCALAPTTNLRNMGFMLLAIGPVLIWAQMGEREARWQTGALVYTAAGSLLRVLLAAWLAGVLLTALIFSGVLVGRGLAGEAPQLQLQSWCLSVLFVPTLALALGVLTRSSKPFEVIYPILWYLGPMNPQNGLVILDYLGIHATASVITQPLGYVGLIILLLGLTCLARRHECI